LTPKLQDTRKAPTYIKRVFNDASSKKTEAKKIVKKEALTSKLQNTMKAPTYIKKAYYDASSK